MEQVLQRDADAEVLAAVMASVQPHANRSPMDLVCSRVRRMSHLHRPHAQRLRPGDGGAPEASPATGGADEYEYRIAVPNPRYPLPAPRIVEHHRTRESAAAAWGADGDTQGLGADLALTVMAAYLPFRMSDHEGAVRARDGTPISRRAERHYRAFNERFLVTMPSDGGVVTEAAVRGWIDTQEAADARRVA